MFWHKLKNNPLKKQIMPTSPTNQTKIKCFFHTDLAVLMHTDNRVSPPSADFIKVTKTYNLHILYTNSESFP